MGIDAVRAFLDEASIASGWDAPSRVIDEAVAIEHAVADRGEALRAMVRVLGREGILRLIADPDDADREIGEPRIDWRAVCLCRERLGHASPLLELAFAMQGLGSYPISANGTPEQRARWLPAIVRGDHVAAFALTEPDAGSDLSGIATTARRDGDRYVLEGRKVFISNAPIADVFVVFAATAPAGQPRRISAFVVPRPAHGVQTRSTPVLGGHPIGELILDRVAVPLEDRLGTEGDGMRAALGTLHRFRTTVGAAALGFAQRALDEALDHTKRRVQFGKPLAEQQAVQMALADMACDLEAARLLVYRAAALADARTGDRDAEAFAGSMAKLCATEAASRVVDRAVQLHGGRGVLSDHPVARLYEDVRALRIYEGASDIQRVLIARHLLGGR